MQVDQGRRRPGSGAAGPDVTVPSAAGTGTDLRSPIRRAGEQTLYLLAGFWLSLLAAAVVTILTLAGAGLLVVGVGLLLLVLAARLARTFAAGERRLIRQFLRHPARTPPYLDGDDSAGGRYRLRDPQTWLDIVHAVVGIVFRTVGLGVTLVWWIGAIAGIGWVLWGWALSIPDGLPSVPELIGLPGAYLIDLVFYTLVGVVFLLTLPVVVRAMAWLAAGPAVMLLSGRALQQQVQQLTEGRQAARSAEAGSLRRLERDIHDGPQQRLVRLAMDLGRVRKQIDADPDRARDLLDEAIGQTRSTLDELRALSRGIAPPILSDRGLSAALSEIVARSTIPVHLQADVPDDLPDHVQTAAYFVVSETLVNVAKHAMATYAVVEVSSDGRMLTVTVSDDGVGGAQLAKGHGLVGLADRVRGVDGVLNVSSPGGGPTVVTAEIPCAS